MNKKLVFVVDDEEDIRTLVSYNLEREGCICESFDDGQSLLDRLEKKHPDLIVLDLMLPDMNGLDICRTLKRDSDTEKIPVLMLTARTEDSDIILGLEMGADDYVGKPFSIQVLLARIRAVLRRNVKKTTASDEGIIEVHGIRIDTARHRVKVDGETVDLSATEFAILEHLGANPGWVYSRAQIINAVKGDDYPVTARAVDVQILGLRKRLGDKGALIETVRGIGYRMKDL